MEKYQLLEPILKEGLRSSHFFNGRLLTAEALTTEREAYRAQDGQLGEGLGEGVVRGLWVSTSGTDTGGKTLLVTAGLGFARDGESLELPMPIELAITVEASAVAKGAGLFADCTEVPIGTKTLGRGLHLLTIGPANGFQGRVRQLAVTGRGDAAAGHGCGRRHVVEGVRFRLIPLSPDLFGQDQKTITVALTTATPTARSFLRNLVAHACFGTRDWRALGGDLYGKLRAGLELDDFGVLGTLRGKGGTLGPAQLPLAIVHWTGSKVDLVDNWSVRRITRPAWQQDGWQAVQRSRQEALREAILLQFQEHIEALVIDAGTSTFSLSECFRFLPPVGAIPAAALSPGKWKRTPELDMPAQRWRQLLGLGLEHEPVAVEDGEVFTIYRDEDNGKAKVRFVWFASEAVACRFCVPLSYTADGVTTSRAKLQTLFAATAEVYSKLQMYALAARQRVEGDPGALMALFVGAGQVATVARTLDVMASDACCFDYRKSLDAMAGLRDAQSDLLLGIAALKAWLNPPLASEASPQPEIPTAIYLGPEWTRASLDRPRERVRDEATARITSIAADNTFRADEAFWGSMKPKIFNRMSKNLAKMKEDLVGDDGSAAAAKIQVKINRRWRTFLKLAWG